MPTHLPARSCQRGIGLVTIAYICRLAISTESERHEKKIVSSDSMKAVKPSE